FEAERQALALMDHPNIARVFDGGMTQSGRPYFVMELVRGTPITEYCDREQLSIPERLDLFVLVCRAVQHAHQKGIIHRDLKPGNILVDEAGQPRILDFGVARSTAADLTSGGATSAGDILGTLPYMSPEQVTLDPAAIDVRSDIYALGVVLYELLAGRLPYDVRGKVMLEAMRVITEDDPAPLSTVDKLYRGDIETIVAKALEKERERRYDSAAELGADIRRHLDEEPITARPPSTVYQLRKFARRNRALVGGVAAVFLVLLAGVGISTWQAVRARRAERLASREAAKAAAVNEFLQSMLRAASPDQSPGRDMTVREMIDVAARRAGEDGPGATPEVAATVRSTLGDVYITLDRLDSAAVQLAAAMAIYRDAGLDRTADGNLARLDLANVYSERSRRDEAARLVEEARPIAEARRPPDFRELASLRGQQCRVRYYAGNFVDALALQREALEFRRRVPGVKPEQIAEELDALGFYHSELSEYDAADSLARDALRILTATYGTDHSKTLSGYVKLADVQLLKLDLAGVDSTLQIGKAAARRLYGDKDSRIMADFLWREGRLLNARHEYARADSVHRICLAMREHVLGPNHNDVATSMSSVAGQTARFGNLAQADSLYRAAMDIRVREFGEDSPAVLASWNDVASLYEMYGQRERADSVYVAVVPRWRNHPGNEGNGEFMAITGAALNRQAMGDLPTSEMWFRRALAICREALGEDNLMVAKCLDNLGPSLFFQGRKDSAEIMIRQALEIRRRKAPNTRIHALSLSNLGVILDDRKDYAGAESLYVEQLDIARNHEPSKLVDAMSQLGRNYLFQEKWEPAEALLREAVELQAKRGETDRVSILMNQARLGRALVGLKRYAEAEPLLVPVVPELAGKVPMRRAKLALVWLADYYDATNQPALAKEWRDKAAAG
ncbi:MAG TPA: serine/threonine-protein kinase, partial [Candidatus Eisenbacteria bacterium]